MFREALLRQTSHVQFIVIEREDQNRNTKKGAADDGKLRETTSFFLLAYFFPGSEVNTNYHNAPQFWNLFSTEVVEVARLLVQSADIFPYSLLWRKYFKKLTYTVFIHFHFLSILRRSSGAAFPSAWSAPAPPPA